MTKKKNKASKEGIEKKEKKKSKKEQKEKQEKQIRLAIFVMVGLIAFIFLINLIVKSTETFEYEGLEFKKGKEGKIIYYNTNLPLKNKYGETIKYLPFSFRNDPRDLEYIQVNTEEIILKKNMSIASSKKDIESCKDSIKAAATLSIPFFSQIGVKAFPGTPNKSEANLTKSTYINCSESSYKAVIFKKSNESSIEQKGNCYLLNVANCTNMELAEKFIIEWYKDYKAI